MSAASALGIHVPHPVGRPSAVQTACLATLSWRDSSTYSRHIVGQFGAIKAVNHAMIVQNAISECRPLIP